MAVKTEREIGMLQLLLDAFSGDIERIIVTHVSYHCVYVVGERCFTWEQRLLFAEEIVRKLCESSADKCN